MDSRATPELLSSEYREDEANGKDAIRMEQAHEETSEIGRTSAVELEDGTAEE